MGVLEKISSFSLRELGHALWLGTDASRGMGLENWALQHLNITEFCGFKENKNLRGILSLHKNSQRNYLAEDV